MTFAFDPKLNVTCDGQSYIFNKINIGNGEKYKIPVSEMNDSIYSRMNLDKMMDFVQIFIHIRNEVGLDSAPPHKFNIKMLHDGIQEFHKEYVKLYNMPFSYGYEAFAHTSNVCNVSQLIKDLHTYGDAPEKKPELNRNIFYDNYTVKSLS